MRCLCVVEWCLMLRLAGRSSSHLWWEDGCKIYEHVVNINTQSRQEYYAQNYTQHSHLPTIVKKSIICKDRVQQSWLGRIKVFDKVSYFNQKPLVEPTARLLWKHLKPSSTHPQSPSIFPFFSVVLVMMMMVVMMVMRLMTMTLQCCVVWCGACDQWCYNIITVGLRPPKWFSNQPDWCSGLPHAAWLTMAVNTISMGFKYRSVWEAEPG